MLGQFGVARSGREIPPESFGGRLARRLVRILVSRRGHTVPRDLLIEYLWPREAPRDPEANLNVQVNRARRALGKSSLIETTPSGYRFDEDPACCVDVEVFLQLGELAWRRLSGGLPGTALSSFRKALDVWRGDPLIEDAYEGWAREYIQQLIDCHASVLEGAAAAALQVGLPGQAVMFARRAVARQPYNEQPLMLWVQALVAVGDRVGALRAIGEFESRLISDVGLTLSPGTRDFVGQVLAGQMADKELVSRTGASAPAFTRG